MQAWFGVAAPAKTGKQAIGQLIGWFMWPTSAAASAARDDDDRIMREAGIKSEWQRRA